MVVGAAASTPSAVGTAVASPMPGNGSILAHASADGHPLAAIIHKNKEETAQVIAEEDVLGDGAEYFASEGGRVQGGPCRRGLSFVDNIVNYSPAGGLILSRPVAH